MCVLTSHTRLPWSSRSSFVWKPFGFSWAPAQAATRCLVTPHTQCFNLNYFECQKLFHKTEDFPNVNQNTRKTGRFNTPVIKTVWTSSSNALTVKEELLKHLLCKSRSVCLLSLFTSTSMHAVHNAGWYCWSFSAALYRFGVDTSHLL